MAGSFRRPPARRRRPARLFAKPRLTHLPLKPSTRPPLVRFLLRGHGGGGAHASRRIVAARWDSRHGPARTRAPRFPYGRRRCHGPPPVRQPRLLLRLQRHCLLRRQIPRSTGWMTAQRHHARCICQQNHTTMTEPQRCYIWIFRFLYLRFTLCKCSLD
jgi:hypothetical protein